MFEIALILAIIVGYLRGGSFGRLSKFEFRYGYLIIAAVAVQIAINFVMKVWSEPVFAYLLLITSYMLMLAAVWFNRENEFLFLVLIGLILNFIVIAVNGGMPVSFGAAKMLGVSSKLYLKDLAYDFKHVVLTTNTKLKFLADIIPLPKPYPLPGIFSVGDVFISIGIFFYLQNYMVYRGKH